MLLDSALGSDFSGAAAVCSFEVPLPGAAAGGALDEDSPAGVSVGVAESGAGAVAAGAVPAAGAGCSAAGGVVASGVEVVGSMAFGRLLTSEPVPTSLVPEGLLVPAGAAVESPVESPEPAGTVSTATEFPFPPPPPADRTAGTAPGLSTSVAEVASTGGVKFGAPLRAAAETSGLLLIMPMERRTTARTLIGVFFLFGNARESSLIGLRNGNAGGGQFFLRIADDIPSPDIRARCGRNIDRRFRASPTCQKYFQPSTALCRSENKAGSAR